MHESILVSKALKKQSVTGPLGIRPVVRLREKGESTGGTGKRLTIVTPIQEIIAAATFGWFQGEQTGQKKRTHAGVALGGIGVVGDYEQDYYTH